MYYLECEAGIAGDMMVAALLDMGADEKKLTDVLGSLPLDGYEIRISRVKKAGIDACDFNVILDADHENHDHDMNYLHGDIKTHSHEHDHEHEHEHEHEHNHDEDPHEHHHDHDHGSHEQGHHHRHEHRHLKDVYAIIDAGKMSDRARELAKRIFMIVAEAESKAHALPVDEVHFHEVGAVDSIVDIVAAAVCLDDLNIDSLIVPYLAEGEGTVRCAHGILPIPVPAVQHITQTYAIPLKYIGVKGEFVTPTGAAIVAALRSDEALPEVYTIKRCGYGAGKRNYERASLVRLYELQDDTERTILDEDKDLIWRLESDIDDSTGESLGYLMQALYEAGAREVHYTPIQMKKNRPGTELVVICKEDTRLKLEEIIFAESTTIGIRRVQMQRSILPRRMEKLTTKYGELAVKTVTLPDGRVRSYPEYDDIIRIAREKGVAVSEVWAEAVKKID